MKDLLGLVIFVAVLYIGVNLVLAFFAYKAVQNAGVDFSSLP